MFQKTTQTEVVVHCFEYGYSMIPLCIQSTLLYEMGQVEVCRDGKGCQGKEEWECE